MGRYKFGEVDNERYYQIPKGLFTNPLYKDMGIDAKVIYAFLKDRMALSNKNGWKDENGDIYLLFSQESIADILNCSVSTVSRAMKSLRQYDLIDVMRQGLNKPNKIYIRHIKTCTGDLSGHVTDANQDTSPVQTNETDINETEYSETENKRIEDREINLDSKNTSSSSSFSSSLGEIKTKWESTFHPLMKAGDLETLDAYIQDYGRMGVLNAIETAGKRKNLNRATLSPRYLLPILKNPTSKPEEPRRNVIPMITDRNEKEYWARLRREDEARQAEAKRLGEDDPYGIYGESS